MVHFPSKNFLLEFINIGKFSCGSAIVAFSRCEYPHAYFGSKDVIRKHLKLSGIPPACWKVEDSNFLLNNLGSVVDIKSKHKLGNDYLQVIHIDIRKDLMVSEFMVVYHYQKVLIILVDDLNLGNAVDDS